LVSVLGELHDFIGDFGFTSWDLEWEWVRWFAIIFVIVRVLSVFSSSSGPSTSCGP
jgi:hypothetical protein